MIVEPYPPYLEKTAPGGQAVPPSADGKPGKYLINAYNASEQSRAGLESTAFHEAYPGHHMQVAVALERKDLHPISRYFFLSGFGEGWALYCGTAGRRDGPVLIGRRSPGPALERSPARGAARRRLGHARARLDARSRRSTTCWRTRPRRRSRAAAEIDRYIAVPAQATAYMIGNLEIRKLRD